METSTHDLNLKIGDIVRYKEGRFIYKVIDIRRDTYNRLIVELVHTLGRRICEPLEMFKLRCIKLDISLSDFNKLPAYPSDYPEWAGINPHNKIENLKGEKWFPIKNHEGLYEVSNRARIKSLHAYGLKNNEKILTTRDPLDPITKLFNNGDYSYYSVYEIIKENLPPNEHIEAKKSLDEAKNNRIQYQRMLNARFRYYKKLSDGDAND